MKRVLGLAHSGDVDFFVEDDCGYYFVKPSSLLRSLAQAHDEDYIIKTFWEEDMENVTKEDELALEAFHSLYASNEMPAFKAFDLLWNNPATSEDYLV